MSGARISEKSDLEKISDILRRDVLQMTSSAGSGHPTSCLSCAEIFSVLFFNIMKYDVKNPENTDNDEFILSKGHAAPILYSALFRVGATKENLFRLRKFSSNLEGHPIPSSFKWTKIATGSLGQGLSVGVGMALASQKQNKKSKVFVLLGDGEIAEGSVWEAVQIAAHYKTKNLTAIIDVNRLGQSGETIHGHDMEKYRKKFEAFGWKSEIVDGHSVKKLSASLKKQSDKPTAIIAKTIKGKGVSFLEDKEKWHGKVLNEEELQIALSEIPNWKMPRFNISKPLVSNFKFNGRKNAQKFYSFGTQVSTREAYGESLSELAHSNEKILSIDAEVSNSTFSEKVRLSSPSQFLESFIAEQNMVGMGLGFSKKGYEVFCSTFSAFFSRAHDQIRMSAISSANMNFVGSHSGVSIGEDGASQMGLEDISIFRALPNSFIFYPCDGNSTKKITEEMTKIKGIKYLRTTRGKTPILYRPEEKFEIGRFKILKKSDRDKAVLIGAGITVFENLSAWEKLLLKGINVAVVDLYCIKPLNSNLLKKFILKHGGKVLISEDHRIEGGIGEMILREMSDSEIKIKSIGVKGIPHSGKSLELLKSQGLDSESIAYTLSEFIR